MEGIAGVIAALDGAAEVRMLLVAPSLLTSDVGFAAAGSFSEGGGTVVELSDTAFAAVSDRDNPVGLAAVVHKELVPLERLQVSHPALLVALDDVGNPGNLGTIVRTADAVGASVVLIGNTTDPWHPSSVKASMGAIFSVDLGRVDSIAAAVAWARAHAIQVVTTSARASTSHWLGDYSSSSMFVLGSEATGLSPEELRAGDLSVRIPMRGRVSSLNVAVAGSILLYEASRAQSRLVER